MSRSVCPLRRSSWEKVVSSGKRLNRMYTSAAPAAAWSGPSVSLSLVCQAVIEVMVAFPSQSVSRSSRRVTP